ncbi:MAG: hypothetical protein AAF570_10270, partial [Bacteroidota bacterium]
HRRAGKYKYFKFMRCSDPLDAFQWECLFWHKGQATIDNAEARGGKHPQPPRSHPDAECPFPGCDYEFQSYVEPEPAFEAAAVEEAEE